MPTVQETTSIGEQLKALVRLQHIDSKIDQVRKLRGDLPDEIRDLEDERAGLETRIRNLRQEQEDNVTARGKAERDIKESESLIKRYEEQQLQVRNNREYDALTKEIEVQKQRIAEAQARIEEIETNGPVLATTIMEAEQRLAEGRIRRIDRNAAVVEAARAGREAASAAIESAKAAAEVRRLLGLAADEPLELEGTLAPRAVFPAPVPVPDPVRPRQAPAVLEARLSLREAQARRALADAAAAPDLTVGAYFLRELDTDHLFATVAIPLPLFDRNESERAAARREEAQAEAALVETERSIAAAREEARVRLGAAGAAVAAWEAAALEAVNENLALATEAFREGDIGFPAYLLLRREALAGRLAWIDALEELALAQAEWERLAATGGE